MSQFRIFFNDWFVKRLSIQTLLIGLTQFITVIFLSKHTNIISAASYESALVAIIVYALFQSIFWYFFVKFICRLHPFLYPVLSFILSGIFVLLVVHVIPGLFVSSLINSILVVIILTVTSTIAAVVFGMDDDTWFDFNVTNEIIKRYKRAENSTLPGFIFLEIDGLSYDVLIKAIDDGYMPTIKRLIEESHNLTSWETDLSSQTAAMQAGITQGSNKDIPAYRWYDRKNKRIVNSANPIDAKNNEARLTNHHGLLEKGGSSRGNMFSGDAAENLFTYSTLFDNKREKSPDFYLFLLNPYVLSRIITKFFLEIVFEIIDGLKQWMFDKKNPKISRAFPYPLVRAVMNSLLPELVTHIGIIDILRGIPAMYLLYPGYDDLAHFAGIARKDTLSALSSIDARFARIEKVIKKAPRPYNLVILSDHGQSEGVYFKKRYGIGLEELVKSLIVDKMKIYAKLETNEESYLVNSILTDASRQDLKTSNLLRKTLANNTKNGYVDVTSKIATKDVKNNVNEKDADLIILASGSLGLIYYGKTGKRITYEQIEDILPGFLQGLANHEGIGFVMVNSEKIGGIVIGNKGKYYLNKGKIEGTNPLIDYGRNAVTHLLKENEYSNAPDILVNSKYDISKEEISGFEYQVGHHGGLGGYQNHGFVIYPKALPIKKEIIGAVDLYTIFHSWRKIK